MQLCLADKKPVIEVPKEVQEKVKLEASEKPDSDMDDIDAMLYGTEEKQQRNFSLRYTFYTLSLQQQLYSLRQNKLQVLRPMEPRRTVTCLEVTLSAQKTSFLHITC